MPDDAGERGRAMGLGSIDDTLPIPDGGIDAADRAHLLNLVAMGLIIHRPWRLLPSDDPIIVRRNFTSANRIFGEIKDELDALKVRLTAGGL